MKKEKKAGIVLFVYFIVYSLIVFIFFPELWKSVFIALGVFIALLLIFLVLHEKKKHRFFFGHTRYIL